MSGCSSEPTKHLLKNTNHINSFALIQHYQHLNAIYLIPLSINADVLYDIIQHTTIGFECHHACFYFVNSSASVYLCICDER